MRCSVLGRFWLQHDKCDDTCLLGARSHQDSARQWEHMTRKEKREERRSTVCTSCAPPTATRPSTNATKIPAEHCKKTLAMREWAAELWASMATFPSPYDYNSHAVFTVKKTKEMPRTLKRRATIKQQSPLPRHVLQTNVATVNTVSPL